MSIYSIGVSALSAAQTGLATTEHNISNVNTSGYNRQQIVQSANVAQYSGSGFVGQGVHVDTVKRIYDQFLASQVLQAQTQSSQLESYSAQIQQIDNMLADPNAGVSPALQGFFNGVQDVASNPASVPSRQAMLSGAQTMAARFQSINQRFTEIRDGVNSQVTSSVGEVNSYARQIANLNQQIVVAQGSAGAQQPANDLLDQRDQLIGELNQVVKVTTVKQDNGSLNVFIGNGQSLVLGTQSITLGAAASPEDPEKIDVGISFGGSITLFQKGSLTGGTLGGLLAFRDETLDSAQNALGRVAIGLAQTFNDQHKLGMDLNGKLGGDFFNMASPKVIPNTGNPAGTASPTVTFNDVSAVTTSDYKLSYNGASWSLLNTTTTTGQAVAMSGAGTAASPYLADGLSIVVPITSPSGPASFLIKPTINGARDISVNLTDTSAIAAAAPIKTSALVSNTGSGAISAGAVNSFNDKVIFAFNAVGNAFDVVDNTTGATLATNVTYTGAPTVVAYNGWQAMISGGAASNATFVVDHTLASATTSPAISQPVPVPPATKFGPDPHLQDPVTITFNAGGATFNVSGAVPAVVLPVAYTPGSPISYNGWTVQISGTPAVGDAFTVGTNAGGVADNRNALLLAGLQTQNTLAKNALGIGTTSYQGAYSQLVSLVGNKTNEIEVTAKAQASLVSQTQQAQQSLSGVNLDEEAANLLRYQQAYQAAGKMMQIATTLFATLLSLGQ